MHELRLEEQIISLCLIELFNKLMVHQVLNIHQVEVRFDQVLIGSLLTFQKDTLIIEFFFQLVGNEQ